MKEKGRINCPNNVRIVCSSLGWLVSICRTKGEVLGQKPTKNGSYWPLITVMLRHSFHLLSLSLLLCLVKACPTFVILPVCSSHQAWGQGHHPWADSAALPNLSSGAAFGKLPRS